MAKLWVVVKTDSIDFWHEILHKKCTFLFYAFFLAIMVGAALKSERCHNTLELTCPLITTKSSPFTVILLQAVSLAFKAPAMVDSASLNRRAIVADLQ